MLKKQSFTKSQLPPEPAPGEATFYGNGSTNVFSWVVPANVNFISAVVVGQGALGGGQLVSKISRGGTDLLTSTDTIAGAVGGGNGGAGSYGMGGAGGYSGNGGAGDNTASGNGSAGSGGGGGGGATSGKGGPVGLKGQGANGSGGVYGGVTRGGTGSPSATGFPAGINVGMQFGTPGGNLRYRNNIPVTPGETLTVTLSSNSAPNSNGESGGVRIMWGNDGRTYPSNAADAVPIGQAVIVLSDTTWTVPTNVTSISVAAQQQNGSSAAVTLVVSGSTVLRAQNGARIGDGGGDGGAAADGGGGGGGYAGNGGNGGGTTYNTDGSTTGQAGGNGAGGGGAGGGGLTSYTYEETIPVFGGSGSGTVTRYYTAGPYAGGGVGISGQGASGVASTSPQGSPDPVNGYMGGGAPAQAGGALAYKNAIAVTPGQVLTVNAAGGRIRIIWGPGRSYPSAAGDL